MSSHKILSQAHLIPHSFRHLHYHIVNSWPWLEKHNVGAVQIQKNHFIPETCGCLSTSTGIFLQVVPALTIRMFRSAASNIMLGVSTAGSSMDIYENQKSICSNVTCVQAKIHTDDNGEQKVASIFHLQHNSMVWRRVPQS